MKKYIFMAVAGMLALSSCSNDDNEIQDVKNAPRTMTFTAGYSDGEQTRATLNADKTVSFDAGDEISIFSANNNNVKFTTTAGGATASFTGTATEGDPTYFALYPYQEELTLDGTTIKNVYIPMVQKVTTHAWDPKAAIAYATTTGTSLTFHNACALLKVTNDSEDDIEILIADDASVGQLSGTFDLDTSTGALTVQTDQGSTAVIVQHVPNNTTIYIAIAPGTVEKLYANWYNTGTINYGEKKKSTPVTFEAGKIYNLGKTSEWESH